MRLAFLSGVLLAFSSQSADAQIRDSVQCRVSSQPVKQDKYKFRPWYGRARPVVQPDQLFRGCCLLEALWVQEHT